MRNTQHSWGKKMSVLISLRHYLIMEYFKYERQVDPLGTSSRHLGFRSHPSFLYGKIQPANTALGQLALYPATYSVPGTQEDTLISSHFSSSFSVVIILLLHVKTVTVR